MTVPGSNLLRQALRVIASQQVAWYKAGFRTLNTIGQDVTTYDQPINVRGSFQPVPRSLYETLGLDFQKEYFRLFAPANIIDISRNISADLIVFQNVTYQCLSAQEWYGLDGWVEMLLIAIISPAWLNAAPIFGFGNFFSGFDQAGFSPGQDGG